jgi:hypothetical protein
MEKNRNPRVPSSIGFYRLGCISGLVLATSFALPTQAAAALAVTSVSPIIIEGCRIRNTRSYVSADRSIELAFTNRRAMAADEIRFTVEYAGRSEHIIDKGTFSQNVRIDHAFNGFYNARYRGMPPNCSVDYVRFLDDSVWTPASSSTVPTCPQSPSG